MGRKAGIDGREARQKERVPRIACASTPVRNSPCQQGCHCAMTSLPGAPERTTAEAGLERDHLIRYARHLSLSEIGLEGQALLGAARVLVVGAGGLGSPVALYLAAAGVGTVGLVDADVVDMTNLQRQIVHGSASVGNAKVASAAARLRDLNPEVQIVEISQRLNRRNALEILQGWDLIVDGSDNFPTRYLINDAGVMLKTPVVYGAILRWEGQVSLFATPEGPCYRCLFREPPPAGLVPSCADAGVVGALAGVVGSMQALEVIKAVVGAGTSLAGRLLLFDGLAAQWREIEVRRDPACPMCGDEPSIHELVDYEQFCGVKADGRTPRSGSEREISARRLHDLLQTSSPPLIVDVREDWEWRAGNLSRQGALHLPLASLASGANALPGDRLLVAVCSVGARSAGAAQWLREHGFDGAVNLEGGLQSWVRDVDPSFSLA